MEPAHADLAGPHQRAQGTNAAKRAGQRQAQAGREGTRSSGRGWNGQTGAPAGLRPAGLAAPQYQQLLVSALTLRWPSRPAGRHARGATSAWQAGDPQQARASAHSQAVGAGTHPGEERAPGGPAGTVKLQAGQSGSQGWEAPHGPTVTTTCRNALGTRFPSMPPN